MAMAVGTQLWLGFNLVPRTSMCHRVRAKKKKKGLNRIRLSCLR